MASQVWIPESAREKRFHCELCGTEFPARHRNRFHRHLKKCVSRNYGEIQQAVHESRNSVFDTHADKERYKYEREKAEREKRPGIKGIAGYDGR